jgi:DNA-binding MarR family transcriptional regulator
MFKAPNKPTLHHQPPLGNRRKSATRSNPAGKALMAAAKSGRSSGRNAVTTRYVVPHTTGVKAVVAVTFKLSMILLLLYIVFLYIEILYTVPTFYLDVNIFGTESYNGVMEGDAVDRILGQWASERPDLDASPMGIFGRLSRGAKLLDRSLAATFAEFGLNGGEFDVLATLRRSGEPYSLTPTELFRSMMLSSAAMTNRIDRLEERGLVERSPDPDDRRGVRITLTGEGLELVNRAVEAHVAGEGKLLDPLSAEERERLAGLLRKLLVSMEDHPSGTPKVPDDD